MVIAQPNLETQLIHISSIMLCLNFTPFAAYTHIAPAWGSFCDSLTSSTTLKSGWNNEKRVILLLHTTLTDQCLRNCVVPLNLIFQKNTYTETFSCYWWAHRSKITVYLCANDAWSNELLCKVAVIMTLYFYLNKLQFWIVSTQQKGYASQAYLYCGLKLRFTCNSVCF